ncbi:MAG: DNA polymerase III subunit epsilon [Bacteroidetes bacterium GWA2_31_9]|nr:MAG: DNA polymerase III subunit epsilon [Bacteroidetes bacterium GWA2_31_9]
MNLVLNKPLAFIDLETTGINVASDRIVEISILKIMPDKSRESKTMRINPTIPIPENSSNIHGIYDADIKDCPTFVKVAHDLAVFIGNADLAGYNSNKFDVPLLAEEFIRADVDFDMKKRKFVDVQVIFHKMEQRTLSAAYQFYCKKEIENAHSAEADVKATVEVLEAQLDKYPELQNNVDYLNDFSSHSKSVDFLGRIIYDEKGVEVINFGKHKGKAVEEVFRIEPSYYNWMMNGDFPLYTKKIITSIKLRSFGK